jgi:hypothetical protein
MKFFFLISAPLVFTVGYWVFDGARVSLWANNVETREEIPVVEGMPELGTQTKVTWKEEFVCGIETPVFGLVLSLVLFIILLCKKRGLKNMFS